MNWDAIGAIGEVAGALAVVATLAYLAAQMKQNTRALHAASYEHWNTVLGSFTDFIGKHAQELARIDLATSIDDLSPEQRYLFLAHSEKGIVQGETAFLLHNAGSMDIEVFEKRMLALIDYLDAHPLMWEAWDQTKHIRAYEFVTRIEQMKTLRESST